MSKIEFEKLSFAYPGQTAIFNNVSLVIDESWQLGLVGRNGRGKTTLLKIILNQLEYSGKVFAPFDFVYFPQTVTSPELLAYQVAETIADFEQWQLERELRLLQVNPDILWRPYQQLSGGEQTKLLLALLFLADDKLPLIDEPTNHLDMTGRQVVAQYLNSKSGYIVVSHDRAFLNEVTDHIIAIEKTDLVLYQGAFEVYEQEKALRDQFEINQNERLKNEIDRLQKTAKEKSSWSKHREGDKYGHAKIKGSGSINDTGFIGARSARVMKKAKNLERRMNDEIETKSRLLKNLETIDELSINYQQSRHSVLIKAENFSLQFNKDQNDLLFQPTSFELTNFSRLALTGINGSGKSSVLKYLMNEFKGEAAGCVSIASGLKISYISQNFENNKGNLKEFARANHLDYSLFLNQLKKLGMERAVFEQRIETMSMGQRKKIELARALTVPANLYVWDEPLNYLDVFNYRQLEQLILNKLPPMIFVEHDMVFIEKIANQVIQLNKINDI
ncbi:MULTISPECIES: ribosomal protection-like ABC-F family protein [unclassified Enterococcus]|uniref:ribosomal protection-like ABC-F family protein n=1 Tax=unclassified Enterococcus TaxID=2608891 RepID=UPI00155504CF|nr:MULTISPECIES: ABC-F type ribosomal protection protein [unclassified Enterococcus]MBS7578111.1 ABC-F type ribosomal protection protein [Enterococcus sp. MMGLQ5-2]MBS7585371.1 ABC-F type ribosomal protection protein [Enterococcus sp. MMGLQ5-1]NPD13228.1 ABC-F type ribosomal protection protein [Enterococcus sp. MMGLQ5-1]NPD37942.1 ABC-F type ribosomal protection protein [Enterococcus sp. MMGLQ5-2]